MALHLEIHQMRKLQLISLNLFIGNKFELQSLDTDCKRFLTDFEPFHLTITVLPYVEFAKMKSVLVDLNSELISLVERLHIIGPCSLQFRPMMKNLKEVKVSPIQGNTSACTLSKIREENRLMHTPGMCCIDVRA